MGLIRKLTRYAPRAKRLAEQNADKIADGVNKATGFVDDKTKGKYRDKLDKVDDAAKGFADKSGPDISDDTPGSDGPGPDTPR